nr:ABC transporter ATP-binding protein [Rhodococcus sp. 06-621-2]
MVDNVSFALDTRRTLALVGESGSGKSTIAHTVVGNLGRDARIMSGEVLFEGRDLLSLPARQFRSLRGRRLAYVPQNAAGSLDPLVKVGAQVEEVFRVHRIHRDRDVARRSAIEVLGSVGFDRPEDVAHMYPHELSGGMQQRVLIAIAVALGPSVLIADEPTSALDVTVQRRILDLLQDMRETLGLGLLLITHDMGVAADRADEMAVLDRGSIMEHGPTVEVLEAPKTEYGRRLVADSPLVVSEKSVDVTPSEKASSSSAVSVSELVVNYRSRSTGEVNRAVDGISFAVPFGSTLSIVGESGSGKTTVARAISRFLTPSSGLIEVVGKDGVDLGSLSDRDFRARVQLVYQSPSSSLDPRQRVASIIEEPMRAMGIGSRADRVARRNELLDSVGVPRSFARRLPRQLSGGQQQRVAIARALAVSPEILVLDEPVSALDVTVQAQILRLLDELQREYELTYIFISHDLSVVQLISDTVMVMKRGRMVECGAVNDVFTTPRDEYTQALLASIPGRTRQLS